MEKLPQDDVVVLGKDYLWILSYPKELVVFLSSVHTREVEKGERV
jgi:hypothetical protein